MRYPDSILLGSVLVAAALLQCACGGSGGGVTAPAAPSTTFVRSSANPLIVPPLTASTIEWSVADPSILLDPSDNLYKLWYSTGVKNRSTSAERVVLKYAESSDGVTWSVQTAPVLDQPASSSAWDYTNIETPSVILNPDPLAPPAQRFVMFYSGANTTTAAAEGRPTSFPYYRIGLAYSADGKSFTRVAPGLGAQPGLILQASAALFGSLPGTYGDGTIADPEAVVQGGVIHLWFSSFAETAPTPAAPTPRSPLAFGIGHAVSTDGVTWSFPNANPLASLYRGGAPGGGQQPSVIFDAARSRFEMWFTNDTTTENLSITATSFTSLGYWHATSPDGVTWTPDYVARDLQWNASLDYESLGTITGADVIRVGATDRIYYSSWGTRANPDPTIYLCPTQGGGLVPGIFTLSMASRSNIALSSAREVSAVGCLSLPAR